MWYRALYYSAGADGLNMATRWLFLLYCWSTWRIYCNSRSPSIAIEYIIELRISRCNDPWERSIHSGAFFVLFFAFPFLLFFFNSFQSLYGFRVFFVVFGQRWNNQSQGKNTGDKKKQPLKTGLTSFFKLVFFFWTKSAAWTHQICRLRTERIGFPESKRYWTQAEVITLVFLACLYRNSQ